VASLPIFCFKSWFATRWRAAGCLGLSWLPKEGRHFNVVEQDIALAGGMSVKIPGLSIPDSAASFSKDAIEMLPKRGI
jgi:hypothetical protein